MAIFSVPVSLGSDIFLSLRRVAVRGNDDKTWHGGSIAFYSQFVVSHEI